MEVEERDRRDLERLPPHHIEFNEAFVYTISIKVAPLRVEEGDRRDLVHLPHIREFSNEAFVYILSTQRSLQDCTRLYTEESAGLCQAW